MSDMLRWMRDNEARLRQTETKEVPGAPGQAAFYAQGTFTPVYFGSTIAGATTHTLQYGVYQRKGNGVDITLRIAWTATTATGNGQISGLPFASGAASHAMLSVLSANYPYTNAGLRAFIGGGIQFLQLLDQVAGAFAFAAVDAAAELVITGWYPLI